MDLGWTILDDETVELASDIIKDGIEEIYLNHFWTPRQQYTNHAITTIAKISKFKNPVNNFIFYKNCDQHV